MGYKEFICANPGAVALAMAVLVVAVIVLAYQLWYSDGKSGFTAAPCAVGCRRSWDACAGGACRNMWDPAATAEAQALATVGTLAHSTQAERRLQGAVDSATDCPRTADYFGTQHQRS